jgi:hypothetical protein
MRASLIVIVLTLVSLSYVGGRKKGEVTPELAKPTSAASFIVPDLGQPSTSAKVDFGTQVRPILESRCQGCHFAGGKMYERLPFDRAETIKTLGEKLFTRIKDENDRRVIRDFLAQ